MMLLRIAVLALAGLTAWAQDNFASTSQPWTIADLNGDNRADLVVATIEHHNGSLRFGTPVLVQSFAEVEQPTPYLSRFILTVRDFDHDDDADVVLLDAFTRRELSWWANDGAGGLEPGDPSVLAANGNRKRQWLGRDEQTSAHIAWLPTQNAFIKQISLVRWAMPQAWLLPSLVPAAKSQPLLQFYVRGPPALLQL